MRINYFGTKKANVKSIQNCYMISYIYFICNGAIRKVKCCHIFYRLTTKNGGLKLDKELEISSACEAI